VETTVIIPLWGDEDEERLKLLRLMRQHEEAMNALYQADLWITRPYREIRDYLSNLLQQEMNKLQAQTRSYSTFTPAVMLGEIPSNPHPVEPLPERDMEVVSGLSVQRSEGKIVVSPGVIKVRGREIQVNGAVLEEPLPPYKVVVNGSGEIFAASEAAGLVYTLLEVDR